MKKTIIIISIVTLTISCTNKTTEEKENKTEIASTLTDTNQVEQKVSLDETTSEDSIFIEEDSIAFYNSIKEEENIINSFCKCAKAKGSTHRDCKDYTIKLSLQQKTTDDIRNKYFSNSAITKRLSQKTNELNKKFNECSK